MRHLQIRIEPFILVIFCFSHKSMTYLAWHVTVSLKFFQFSFQLTFPVVSQPGKSCCFKKNNRKSDRYSKKWHFTNNFYVQLLYGSMSRSSEDQISSVCRHLRGVVFFDVPTQFIVWFLPRIIPMNVVDRKS